MDRERPKSGHTTERGPSLRSGPDILSQPLLPSRQRAYSILREAVELSRGPVVIGGAAGVGKTWLWRRLEAESPVGREWISVTVSPEMKASDLLILIAFHIGARTPSHSNPGLGLLRAAILDRLSDLEGQGIEVVLTLEESQLLERNAREELTALVNDAGLGSGLRSLVLVGRSFPQQRRSLVDAGGVESRLHARIQLGPIDADEAMVWLRAHYPRHGWSEREVEILHRDARGIPGMLDRLALTIPTPIARVDAESSHQLLETSPAVQSRPAASIAASSVSVPGVEAVSPVPLVGPSKPPIRIEENAVEVGWVPEDPSQEDVFAPPSPTVSSAEIIKEVGPNVPPLVIRPSSPIHAWPADSLDETDPRDAVEIKDHTAAFQAWNEWSRNHASGLPKANAAVTEPLDTTPSFTRREGTQEVWAETEQEFAPYSPIFQRAKPSREP